MPAHTIDKGEKAEGSGGTKRHGTASSGGGDPQAKRARVDSLEHSEVEESAKNLARTPMAELADTLGDTGLEGISLQKRLL